jgi:hypothetical protein
MIAMFECLKFKQSPRVALQRAWEKKEVFNLDAPSMVKIGLETSLVNNVKCSKERLSIVTNVEAKFHLVRSSLIGK